MSWIRRGTVAAFVAGAAVASAVWVGVDEWVTDDDLSDALHLADVRTSGRADGVFALLVESEDVLGASLTMDEVGRSAGTTYFEVRHELWGLTTARACLGSRQGQKVLSTSAFVLPDDQCGPG